VGLTTVWDHGGYSISSAYTEMVANAGGQPLAVLPGCGLEAVGGLDLLILTGGGDPDPVIFGRPGTQVGPVELERPRWEIGLYRMARESGIPVLGICMGMQLMAIAEGAGLIQHIPDGVHDSLDHAGTREQPLRHAIEVVEGGALSRAIRGLESVDSYHHQAIDAVPAGFREAARASDGVIEAIESVQGAPAWGVQWHPERDGSWRCLLEPLLSGGEAEER
jgi:gamma-glutamyl-gamma-aminobutyrate hydrolase PuuD